MALAIMWEKHGKIRPIYGDIGDGLVLFYKHYHSFTLSNITTLVYISGYHCLEESSSWGSSNCHRLLHIFLFTKAIGNSPKSSNNKWVPGTKRSDAASPECSHVLSLSGQFSLSRSLGAETMTLEGFTSL